MKIILTATAILLASTAAHATGWASPEAEANARSAATCGNSTHHYLRKGLHHDRTGSRHLYRRHPERIPP